MLLFSNLFQTDCLAKTGNRRDNGYTVKLIALFNKEFETYKQQTRNNKSPIEINVLTTTSTAPSTVVSYCLQL